MTPEEIYKEYPRKVGRRKALLEIERALRRLVQGEAGKILTEEVAFAGLLRKTALFAVSPAGNNFPFVPHPSTWYHQSRYLDAPEEWSRGRIQAESKTAALARNNREVLARIEAKEGTTGQSGVIVDQGTQRRVSGNVGPNSPPLLRGRS